MIHTFMVGHIGNDPIQRQVNGQVLWNMDLAVSHRKETFWVKLNFWGESNFIQNHVKKGSFVIVTGALQPLNFYTNKSGERTANLTVTIQDIHFGPKREIPAPAKKEQVQNDCFIDMDLPF